jgi:hypothetical protein
MNDAGPNGEDTWMRNIGSVPSVVTGPGARACGACHRADLIAADSAGNLASFDQHTKDNGYRVETADGVWDRVTEKIMSMFK